MLNRNIKILPLYIHVYCIFSSVSCSDRGPKLKQINYIFMNEKKQLSKILRYKLKKKSDTICTKHGLLYFVRCLQADSFTTLSACKQRTKYTKV